MRLNVVKGALVPANDDARQVLNKKTKVGDTIEVEMVNERSAAFNSKVFVTLDEVAKMIGSTMQQLRAEIMYESGRGEDLRLRDGKIVTVLPSMSKLAMTQSELESFWDDARRYILKEVMISLDGDQQERVRNMLGANEQEATNPLAGG